MNLYKAYYSKKIAGLTTATTYIVALDLQEAIQILEDRYDVYELYSVEQTIENVLVAE